MEFVRLSPDHAPCALPLALRQYEQACKACPELIRPEIDKTLLPQLQKLFEKGCGIAALDAGQMLGYLCYWQDIEGFFGNCKGAFSPLHGSAFLGPKRSQLFFRLFAQVSAELAKTGHTSFAQTVFSSDEELGRAMSLCGFGIRCSDAIRSLATPVEHAPLPGISARELSRDELGELLPMAIALTAHLCAAPCFFPCGEEDARRSLMSERRRTFAAFRGGEPVAYMQLSDSGENYLTKFDDMANICGCFARPDVRGTGVPDLLLSHVCNTARKEGKTLLGVDCETLNPTALHYWSKHFTPYTFSYHRRLDERVLD